MSLPELQTHPAEQAPLPPLGGGRVTPPRRVRPYRLDWVALILILVGGGGSGGVGFVLRQLGYYRFEWNASLALGSAASAGLLLMLVVGFVAGRVGRKLCLFEHLVAAFVLFGVASLGASATYLFETGRAVTQGFGVSAPTFALGPTIGGIGGVALGLFLAGFLGSSLATLFGADGALDFGFSFEWFIARRHLMAKKRTTFLSFITWLSVLAVALSVWCMTVVLSVMSGFEGDLKQKILGTNAHAVVLRYASAFEDYEDIAKEVAAVKGVAGVSPFILGQAMVSSRKQVDGILLKGIDPARVNQVTELGDNIEANKGKLEFLTTPEKLDAYLKDHPAVMNPLRSFEVDGRAEMDAEEGLGKGSAPSPINEAPQDPEASEEEADAEAIPGIPGIAIGRELSKSLRVFVGDRLNVISPLSEEMGPMGPVPRSKAFRVVAIFYTGMYEYDSKFAYISLSSAQSFFGMEDAVTGLEIRTVDLDQTRAITHRIVTALEGYPYYTKDWGEMNRNLFSALQLEKLVMAVILAFIVLVSSFVILATLIMMVMEKSKDIAILKSMGARDASIMKIFVLEGLVVGVVGTFLGLGVGLVTCALIASGIIGLDPEVYYIDTLPVQIEGLQIALVCVIAVLLSYLATLYPSVTASRLHPVEGLRDE